MGLNELHDIQVIRVGHQKHNTQVIIDGLVLKGMIMVKVDIEAGSRDRLTIEMVGNVEVTHAETPPLHKGGVLKQALAPGERPRVLQTG